jgi:phage shock protein A
MGVEIQCEECKDYIEEDQIVCMECYEEVDIQKEELENKIDELEQKILDLQDELSHADATINELQSEANGQSS